MPGGGESALCQRREILVKGCSALGALAERVLCMKGGRNLIDAEDICIIEEVI